MKKVYVVTEWEASDGWNAPIGAFPTLHAAYEFARSRYRQELEGGLDGYILAEDVLDGVFSRQMAVALMDGITWWAWYIYAVEVKG